MRYMSDGDDEAENEAEHGDPDGDALYMPSPEPEEETPKGLGSKKADKAGKDVGRSSLLSKIVIVYLLLTILSFALAAIL